MTDFSTVLKDIDGNEIQDQVSDGSAAPRLVKATLGRIAANALLQMYPDEANLEGAIKVKRFALAMKVVDGGKHKLDPADIEVVKERIAKAYGPLVVGRAWALLDPASVKA